MSQLIHEAFQELKSLKEATFSFDRSGTAELQKFLHKDNVDSSDIAIVDPDAETEKELKNNYSGDVILRCCVCGALSREDPENIVIDEDTQRANVDKDCPCCLNTGGFKIVAQYPGDKPEENEEEETTEVEPETEKTEVEEEEKEPMQETLTEAKEVEDLWDKVYDSLIFSNKQQLMDKNDPRSNRVLPGVFDYDQVDFNFDTGDIIVKVKDDAQLEAAKEILDTKFADKGVTYKVFVDKYDKVTPRRLSITIPEDQIIQDVEDKVKTESYEGVDIILADSDVKFFDEETGEIVLTPEASREIDGGDFSDVVVVAFEDDNSEVPHVYDIKEEDADGCIHMKYIGENKPMNESIENISVETDSDTINVKPSEDGKVTVEAQPKEVEAGTLEPVSPETKAEIEAANGIEEESEEEIEEETVEEPETSVEEDEGEVEVTDFDEDQFNELGESYLKEVYDNVNSFKTTKGYIDGDRIKLEGLINFNSGKQAKTSFVFESFNVSKRGKYKFIGENIQITNRKNAFIMSGDIKEGKLLPESLTYNYNAKDANTGKLQRVYGTVKIKK